MARWKPGESGHPAGRPPGAIGKQTAIRRQLLDDLPSILAGMVQQAQGGDVQAARMLCELAMPRLKPTAEAVELPGLGEADSLADKGQTVIVAMADGTIGPDVAAQMLAALGQQGRILELEQLEERIAKLEQANVRI